MQQAPKDIERTATAALDVAFRVHRQFGPGLLESVYETVLADGLTHRGFVIERQKSVDIEFEGRLLVDAFRTDIIVDDILIIEIKSVERLAAVHAKQLLTYLRLTRKPLGLLMNFNVNLFKEGVRRLSNDYYGDWR